MTDEERRTTFAAGFRAGFECSREGFNGGCAFDHLAPYDADYDGLWDEHLEDEGPISAELKRLEQEAFTAWTNVRIRP